MTTDEALPRTRAARTRRDIVQAAITCWAADSGASLGQVAEAAGVGRTTLNRYFTDRAELLTAVDLEARVRFVDAVGRARPDEDSGLVALQRLCVQIVELGELLGLIFADNAVVDPDTWTETGAETGDGTGGGTGGDGGDPLYAAAARGAVDGSIDPELPPAWVCTLAWTSLFAAWLSISSGQTTRHEAALLLTRTLARGVAG